MSLPDNNEINKQTEPKQPNYLVVFLALAVLTAIEVGVSYYLPDQRVYYLVPLAFVKAGLVVLYFMHLKFDKNVFGAVFVMGVLMGVSLIIVFSIMFAPLLGFNAR